MVPGAGKEYFIDSEETWIPVPAPPACPNLISLTWYLLGGSELLHGGGEGLNHLLEILDMKWGKV